MEKQPILAIALIVPILGLFGGKIDFKKKEPVQWLKFREGAIQVTAQRLRVVHRHCKNFLISCYSIIQFS